MCARARSPSGQERQRSRQPRAREGEAGKAGVPRAPRREQVSLSASCVFTTAACAGPGCGRTNDRAGWEGARLFGLTSILLPGCGEVRGVFVH